MGMAFPVDGSEREPVALPLGPWGGGWPPGSVFTAWLGIWLCDITHLCLVASGQTCRPAFMCLWEGREAVS